MKNEGSMEKAFLKIMESPLTFPKTILFGNKNKLKPTDMLINPIIRYKYLYMFSHL